jgi:hypothetical protein
MKRIVFSCGIAVTCLLFAGAGCAKEAADDARVNGGNQPSAELPDGSSAESDNANPNNPDLPPGMPPGMNPMGEDIKPTGSGDPNDSMCEAKDGSSISLGEAKRLGKEGECGSLLGEFEGGGMCNYETETWWVGITPKAGMEKANCNPACVINVKTKAVEINWRCTGLIPPQ